MLDLLAQVHLLLDGLVAMVDEGVNNARHGEDASHDGTHACQEVQERHPGLVVLHLRPTHPIFACPSLHVLHQKVPKSAMSGTCRCRSCNYVMAAVQEEV